MDDNLYLKIHLWVVTGLVGVIGFFIKMWMDDRKNKEDELRQEQQKMEEEQVRMEAEIMANKQELSEKADAMFIRAVEKFSEAADRLDRTVSGLETIVQVIKQQNIDFARRMEEKDKWLDEHDKSINDMGHRLSAIETICKIAHGH